MKSTPADFLQRSSPYLCGLIFSFSALVMLGWQLQHPLLLQLQPTLGTMQFNTALGLLLSSVACWLLHQQRPVVARVLASIALILPSMTIVQMLSGWDLHIDQLFMQDYLLSNKATPGRMAPNTALTLLLTDLALVLFSLPLAERAKNTLLTLLPPSVMGLALTALFGYATQTPTAYGWGELTRMSLQTATCFVLFSIALYGLPHNKQKSWTPSIGIALLVLLLGLWQALERNEENQLRVQVQLRAAQWQSQALGRQSLSVNTMGRIALRWRLDDEQPKASWLKEMSELSEERGYLLFARITADGSPPWVEGSNPELLPALLATFAQGACSTASAETTFHFRNIKPAGLILLDITPLQRQSRDDGCLVSAIRLQDSVANVRSGIGGTATPLTIFAKGQQLYHEPSDGRWSERVKIHLNGVELELQFTPTKAQVSGSALPSLVLFGGLLLGVLLLVITQLLSRRQLEQAQFRQVVEFSPTAMVMIDAQGKIKLVNAQAEKTFGYLRKEMLEQPIEMLLPQRFRQHHVHHRQGFIAAPKSRSMGGGTQALAGRRKDGSEFPLEVALNPISTPEGPRVLSSIIDISERRAHEDQFRQVVELAPYGILLLDHADTIEVINAVAEQLFGVSREDLLGQPITQLLPLNQLKSYLQLRATNPDEDHSAPTQKSETLIAHLPSGEPLPLEITLAKITSDDQQRLIVIAIDLREREATQRQIATHMDTLTRVNNELNNFAYVASHDLKSPLRGIDQLASWISEDMGDAISPEVANHLLLMRTRIKRMEALLSDLLAYSRVGRDGGEQVSVNCDRLVRDIFDLTYSGNAIQLEITSELPTLHTYKTPLELVFRNLISNAIKHHHGAHGTITISAHELPEAVEFSVSDDGPGIAPEHHERVFGMFQTLKPRDEVEGSGMGLAMIKKAVEGLGGSITLESDGSHGSTFRFTWPCQTQHKEL